MKNKNLSFHDKYILYLLWDERFHFRGSTHIIVCIVFIQSLKKILRHDGCASAQCRWLRHQSDTLTV